MGACGRSSNEARRSVRVIVNLAPMASLPNQRLQRAGARGSWGSVAGEFT